MVKRCAWAEKESMHKYHDEEWGVPNHDDKKHFEFLILEGAQAGLSWETILKRRLGYKKAFSDFDVGKIAKYNEKDVERLMNDSGIIRNRLKITSAIKNAKEFLKTQKEFGSFDAYLWSFVNGKPVKNNFKSLKEIPAKTELSDKLSKDLKQRGFSFVGSTIMYAHLQAVGIVNDHLIDCFRRKES
ncbi:MAG TPA: DNA-3-methyladenine glycosylase I [Candidatus Nanoarchaeia archaeon]|nr:DNA-3-methyladenine glycosylase I [Candidatus Nanoarchaeia archaeon]